MKIKYVLLLILTNLITRIASIWVTYTQFIGYIPSYTYPVNLNAGDTIRGFLNWATSEDLDIYLYSNGTDLLNRTTFIDR
jgi:hypothetical protein